MCDGVDAGVTVGRNYKRAREEARELALQRNKFLQEATKAYRRSFNSCILLYFHFKLLLFIKNLYERNDFRGNHITMS